MLKIKAGVTPKNLVIAAAVANVGEILGLGLVITSGTDGQHKPGSKHYTGEALDIRSFNIPEALRPKVIAHLQARLGSDYQVIVEQDHIHIEWDVKP